MVKNLFIFTVAALILSAAGIEPVESAARRPERGEAVPGEEAEYVAPEPTGEVSEGVREIYMEASQFEFDPAEIVVYEGEEVQITAVSTDVTHGLGIDEYGINRRLQPDQEEVVSFTAGEPGTYTIRCTVYCGAGHGEMQGELIVLPRD